MRGMDKLAQVLALAAEGFHVFPIVEGAKAPPLWKDWQKRATTDPTTIHKYWQFNTANVGISTSKFHDGDALLVVDVDNKGDKRGDDEIMRLELDGFELPPTRTQRTPTGGLHYVYKCRRAVKQGANVLAPGLDIRSAGGYIVGAGSTIADAAYTTDATPIADAPEWLIERCGKRKTKAKKTKALEVKTVDPDRAKTRVIAYLENAPPAVEGQGGDEATFKVAARCKDLGVSEDDCVFLMDMHWNDRCAPPWDLADLQVKVRNAYAHGTNEPGCDAPEAQFEEVPDASDATKVLDPLTTLNQEYFFVTAGGGYHIGHETRDAEGVYTLDHLSEAAFHRRFAAKILNKKPMTQQWMEWEGRRSYVGFTFMPERSVPDGFYNLWRGFAKWPSAWSTDKDAFVRQSVELWKEHLLQNACNGDAPLAHWLTAYFAHLIQRPWEKPLVAIVQKGGKGVGKNALIERVTALLGAHGATYDDPRYIVGNFNTHFESALCALFDEAAWAGDKKAESRIKGLTTGSHHQIEPKGKEPYKVRNLLRVLINSNEDWAVNASMDERRWLVLEYGDGRKQDTKFFTDMREGMEQGGYTLLLDYLRQYDISDVNLNMAPQTDALLGQKEASYQPVAQWWSDSLHAGVIVGHPMSPTDWQENITPTAMRNSYRAYCRDHNIRKYDISDVAFGKKLAECCPTIKNMAHRAASGEKPTRHYRVPSIEDCRKLWCQKVGHAIQWPVLDHTLDE